MKQGYRTECATLLGRIVDEAEKAYGMIRRTNRRLVKEACLEGDLRTDLEIQLNNILLLQQEIADLKAGKGV